MKNLLLFDGDPTYRSSIASSIGAESQWEVLGEGADVGDLCGYLSGQPVDVILIGLELSFIERVEIVGWTKSVSPTTRIIWLIPTDGNGSFNVPQFIEGIEAYLLRDVAPVELLFCLQLVDGGGRYLSNEIYLMVMADRLRQSPFLETFTTQLTAFSQQEVQLLQLLSRGVGEESIGRQLSMGLPAVRRHFERLFSITGTNSYASLIRYAVQSGIVS
jgi:DNA-binding NarL/FixJ family response regulator